MYRFCDVKILYFLKKHVKLPKLLDKTVFFVHLSNAIQFFFFKQVYELKFVLNYLFKKEHSNNPYFFKHRGLL